MVHRDAYETRIGPIPEGLTIDHVRNRGCVLKTCCNPAHLEPVTVSVNVLRRPALVSCPQGHSYPESLRIRPDGAGVCRICDRDRSRERRAARRAGIPPKPVGNPGGPQASRSDRYRPSDPDPMHGCPGPAHR
jgi:hypothetical protein